MPRPKVPQDVQAARKKKRNAQSREWNAANRERVKATNKAWVEKNRDHNSAKHKEWLLRNKRSVVDKYAQWYEKNRTQKLASHAEWAAKNPLKVRANYHRRKARLLGNGGSHTAEDILSLMERQKGLCAGCRQNIRLRHTVDHVIPLARGGSNDPDNLQLLCGPCNSRKRDLSPDEWARRIGKLFA